MQHPTNRAERRHHRDRVIAARRFIYQHIWGQSSYQTNSRTNPLECSFHIEQFSEWGRYAKWNLNCGCRMCHYEKYFKEKRKRREALKHLDADWQDHEIPE